MKQLNISKPNESSISLAVIVFLTIQFIAGFQFSFSQTSLDPSSVDADLLNSFILQEVNALRKKAKVNPLANEKALSQASQDHANYMLRKDKLTHNEVKRKKHTPKNRVDFYGKLFSTVGENVLFNFLNLNAPLFDKKINRLDTYEKLAETIVLQWKDSPPHYANMIRKEFETTYTNIAIGEDGKFYACQLFGGSKYQDTYKQQRDTTVQFRPERPWRCFICNLRPPAGFIEVTEDSSIIYHYNPPTVWGFVVPPVFNSRMRFYNPWRDGLMADIIVKSQYTCDSSSNFNGQSNVRGIPLKPVYRKDFNGNGYYNTGIYLGKVPSYLKEEFEVNLVVIQNKRPCNNTLYNVMPSEFHVKIPLSYGFEPSVDVMKKYSKDTVEHRMYFNKSKIVPYDSILPDIIEDIQANKKKIKRIEIEGYASIEGSTEGNQILYSRRANYLIQELLTLGIDSSLIHVTTSENFADFRKDIVGTNYAYLGELPDSVLKEKLQSKAFSTEMEFLLKNHRYVDIKFITQSEYEVEYDKIITNEQLQKSLGEKDVRRSSELQEIQYGLAQAGKMTLEEINSVQIPVDKRNRKLLHNLAVMNFELDSFSVQSLKKFQRKLKVLWMMDSTDEQLNTSLAIIDYHLYTYGLYTYKEKSIYDSIREWKFVDEKQQARMLLNIASNSDWNYFRATGSRKPKDYYYTQAKKYVKPAKLNADKTFEIASYYNFFRDPKYAYEITKNKIDDTKNPEDLIYFLKLIHLTGIDLPRETYLKYFKKIKRYSGKEFCNFFNNPALNFQIFDDQKIKEIYCDECKE